MTNAHHNPEYLKNRGVVLREQPICTVCNRTPSTQVDHILPVDAGGGHDLANLRGICFKCNNTLGHRYVTQRNEMRQTIRAEAMRQNGIRDITEKKTEKQKPFFIHALTALVGWWLTEMPKHRGAPQTVLSTAHRLDLAVMLYDKLA
jgi:hypothetical protein